jgi:hypothetical protein
LKNSSFLDCALIYDFTDLSLHAASILDLRLFFSVVSA